MFKTLQSRDVLITTLAAAGILMLTMGVRNSMGLFVGPLNTATGLGIVSISFAMAVGQFVWGAVQPFAGIAADRWGARAVLVTGVLMLAAGTALVPLQSSSVGLVLMLGIVSTAGAGLTGFSMLIGAASQKLPPESRGAASGVINAGGSAGQFVVAPLAQGLIQAIGWVGALWSLAVLALASLPLVGKLVSSTPSAAPAGHHEPVPGTWHAIAEAMRDRSYLLLHAGFFTCGFHVAFLSTHLPGEVALCGLPPTVASWSIAIIGLANIAGSLFAGSCVGRYRSKYVLAGVYGARAVLVAIYLVVPHTALTFYLLAVGLGFTWLSTVPPTAAIVGKLFHVRHLATLFGLTIFTHQIGGFLGAWLGGIAVTRSGDYTWMWYADMALATLAALANLPIREAPVGPRLAPA